MAKSTNKKPAAGTPAKATKPSTQSNQKPSNAYLLKMIRKLYCVLMVTIYQSKTKFKPSAEDRKANAERAALLFPDEA